VLKLISLSEESTRHYSFIREDISSERDEVRSLCHSRGCQVCEKLTRLTWVNWQNYISLSIVSNSVYEKNITIHDVIVCLNMIKIGHVCICFSPGIWKVITRYTNTPQKTFTADFEVKEYGKMCVNKMLYKW